MKQSTVTETDPRGPYERVDNAERDWTTGDEYFRAVFDDDSPESSPSDSIDAFTTLHTDRNAAARGELWLTSSHFDALWGGEYTCERPKIVLVMTPDMDGEDPYEAGADYRRAEVLPVSFQHQFATHYDFLVDEEDSELGVGFMVEADMPLSLLRGQLSACVGRLPEGLTREAELLRLYAGGLFSTPAGDDLRAHVEENVLTGAAAVGADVSKEFKAQERTNLLYLSDAEEDFGVWLRRREAQDAPVVSLPTSDYRLRTPIAAMADRASEIRDALRDRWVRLGESAGAAYASLERERVPMLANSRDEGDDAEARAMRAYAGDSAVVNVYDDDGNVVDIVTTEDGHFLHVLPERPSNVVRIERLAIDGKAFHVPGSIPGERTPAEANQDGWITLLPILADDDSGDGVPVEVDLYIDEKPVFLAFRAHAS